MAGRIANTPEFEAALKRKQGDLVDPEETQLEPKKPKKDVDPDETQLESKKPKTDDLSSDDDDDGEELSELDQKLNALAHKLNAVITPDYQIDHQQLINLLHFKYFTMPVNDKDGKTKTNVHLTKSKLYMFSKSYFDLMTPAWKTPLNDHPRYEEVVKLCTKKNFSGRKSKFQAVKDWLSIQPPKIDERGQVPQDIQNLIGEALFKKKTHSFTSQLALQVAQWLMCPTMDKQGQMPQDIKNLIVEACFKKRKTEKPTSNPSSPLRVAHAK